MDRQGGTFRVYFLPGKMIPLRKIPGCCFPEVKHKIVFYRVNSQVVQQIWRRSARSARSAGRLGKMIPLRKFPEFFPQICQICEICWPDLLARSAGPPPLRPAQPGSHVEGYQPSHPPTRRCTCHRQPSPKGGLRRLEASRCCNRFRAQYFLMIFPPLPTYQIHFGDSCMEGCQHRPTPQACPTRQPAQPGKLARSAGHLSTARLDRLGASFGPAEGPQTKPTRRRQKRCMAIQADTSGRKQTHQVGTAEKHIPDGFRKS